MHQFIAFLIFWAIQRCSLAEDAIVYLNKDSFQEEIKSDLTFVMFFAPWGSYCKRLAPTWLELAKAFEADQSVTIAKVDCVSNEDFNKDLCDEQGVSSKPLKCE